MLKEFKEFAMKGNVLDLAVGFIIGAAFGKIVTSLVTDIIMPPFGLILGKVDFSNLFINISGKTYGSLAEAKQAGATTVNSSTPSSISSSSRSPFSFWCAWSIAGISPSR